MNVLSYSILSNYEILVTYTNKAIKKLGIYHMSNNSILCDDFETYILRG